MIKKLSVLLTTILLSCCVVWVWYAQQSVKSQVQNFEIEADIQTATMYTNISYRPIMRILEESCSDSSIRKAQSFGIATDHLLTRRYGVDGAYLLTDTQELFDLVSSLQPRVAEYEIEKYCTIKYALNALQLSLREIHLNYMEDNELIDEFDGVDDEMREVNWLSTKIWLLDLHTREYRSSLSSLWTQIQPSIINSEFENNLSTDQGTLLRGAEEFMTIMIADSMVRLRESGLITQSEINQLSDIVKYEYVIDCGLFNGKYEIKQTYRNDQLIDQQPNGLTFKVNICPSFFVIRDLPEIYEKIIIHELGHHVYYFQDEETDAFESLCRESEQQRNNKCINDDFVSQYAQTSALEDYAEHFMFRFLEGVMGDSIILEVKSNHFDQLLVR